MPRWSLAAATQEIARRDPVMAKAIEQMGPVSWRPRSADAFGALVRSIHYQQLAGKAATAIHGRFVALFPDSVTPEGVLALPEAELRGVGLSAAKAASIRDLATKVAEGTVPLGAINRLSDDEIVSRLSVVRGIGRWTAEMFLNFQLRRPDVWPTDDFGVRKGFARIYGRPELPSPRALMEEGERFRPYRTAAALYCWRAVAVLPPSG
ncbi:MAG TPA: DNA-3-methyladenine glycosylase 2 family protein [Actinomycetota bacterium]|nr:DNA-3-methyladenine glycosylase 2 family protein [Actinomycetota bacterium]